MIHFSKTLEKICNLSYWSGYTYGGSSLTSLLRILEGFSIFLTQATLSTSEEIYDAA